jgi:hypothetical protein
VLIEYLTLNYIFAYFELLFDCLINYLYIHVLKLTLGKITFLQIFLWFSAFQCEASRWTRLTVRTQVALLIAHLAVDCPDEFVTRPNAILKGIYPLLSFSASCIPLYSYWIIMSCCVYFSCGFLLRFWHSLHVSSHSVIFSLSSFILLSVCTF